MDLSHIRNFCIVAHIDHGKSTLADRFLQITKTVDPRQFRNQFLDGNSIERERGITIKAKAVAMRYTSRGEDYLLNLIDTPGHVDFSYEVSRSLAACEGAVLLVDATQGVQAQTVANALLSLEGGLEIVPVLNKIDHPTARADDVREEIHNSLSFRPDEITAVSAKTGEGAAELLDRIIDQIPPPKGSPDAPLQALIFDSHFDDFRGVIVYVRLMNGRIRAGDDIRFLRTGTNYRVEEVGVFRPMMEKKGDGLAAGEVGYFLANIKSIKDVKVGDTVAPKSQEVAALPGYLEPVPMVFCGFYPISNSEFDNLKKAMEKLSLNDSSFSFQPETSDALGFGYRCGFLGLLHMEIVQERLERESGVEVIQTAPNVTYELLVRERGESKTIKIDNPARVPDENDIIEFREPIARVDLIVPSDTIGTIMQFCEDRRGKFLKQEYLTPVRAVLTYAIPFAEVVFDFYDKLKSATRGYGTMNYQITEYRAGDLVRLRLLVAGDEIDALSIICHRDQADARGRKVLQILRKEIPRHMFQIALQAAVGARVVARENISAMAKDVTAKCYGGDISRKRKLLEKQKEGKKKMKSIGSVDIPQEAFLAVLKSDVD